MTELNDFNPSREEFKVQDRTLASGLLALRIEFPDNENFVPVTKKIPATMAVSKVKLLLQRVVKRKPHEMVLFYRYDVYSFLSIRRPDQIADPMGKAFKN